MSLVQVLIVDTSSINTLLEVRGANGLDALFASGQNVVLTRNVVREIRNHPTPGLREKFEP